MSLGFLVFLPWHCRRSPPKAKLCTRTCLARSTTDNELASKLQELAVKGGLARGAMPTERVLRANGAYGLAKAIQRQGGYKVVAERLGFTHGKPDSVHTGTESTACSAGTNGTVKLLPRGAWLNHSVLQSAVKDFIRQSATDDPPYVLPSQVQFCRAGRADLARAIGKAGGSESVADACHLLTATDYRFYREMTRLMQQLEELPASGVLPSMSALRTMGRTDVARGIRRLGGHSVVGGRLGLTTARKRRDDTDWGPFSLSVARKLLTLAMERGEVQRGMLRMDSVDELRRQGYEELANFIVGHGGEEHTARRLGLAPNFRT